MGSRPKPVEEGAVCPTPVVTEGMDVFYVPASKKSLDGDGVSAAYSSPVLWLEAQIKEDLCSGEDRLSRLRRLLHGAHLTRVSTPEYLHPMQRGES